MTRAVVCTHKVASDHFQRRGGYRWWTCSGCGIVARWGKRWIYFGNVECLRCGDQLVDAVLCRNCGHGKVTI